MIAASIIFLICIILFIVDRFRPATVALLGCLGMIIFKVLTPAEAFVGFTSDIVLIVFGTEIFGIAFLESGLAHLVGDFISRVSKGNEKKIIIIAGLIGAGLSAFLNNQVICLLMMVICISIAKATPGINAKNITLPVILAAIFGGQMTLIGAPATLVASSLAKKSVGIEIKMFEILPMGLIIFAVGLAFIYFSSYRGGLKIWGKEKENQIDNEELYDYKKPNKRKITVTLIAGGIMLVLFIGGWVSVGVASLIGGLICLVGCAVSQKEVFPRIDWNILIWLGCTIGLTNGFVKGGAVKIFVDWMVTNANGVSPIIILIIFVLLAFFISNLIANTTTVMMLLPFALEVAVKLGFNQHTFLIAITMAAGLSIMTPLSCGFIGMTMRLGYKFKDYVRYSWPLQLVLVGLVLLLSCLFYPL